MSKIVIDTAPEGVVIHTTQKLMALTRAEARNLRDALHAVINGKQKHAEIDWNNEGNALFMSIIIHNEAGR